MKLHTLLGAVALVGLLAAPGAADEKSEAAKKALKDLNEYIGQWKGDGKSSVLKPADWKESAEWGWNLKGGEPSLSLKIDGGKEFVSGVMKYLVDKKKYQLTMTDKDKKERVFLGEIKARKLVLVHEDADTKDKYTIEMSTNNDGARFVYTIAKQNKGVGLAKRIVEVGLTKEGVSLAGGKKNECIVTGGLGTMAVSFNGKTYYVCCSGCRDEFNANPKKYVDEYEKSKKN